MRVSPILVEAEPMFGVLLEDGIRSVYLSNKMRGLPDNGAAWFDETRPVLRVMGITVYCPVELDRLAPLYGDGKDPGTVAAWRRYMRRDLRLLLDIKPDAILLGPQSYDSLGSRVEASMAPAIGARVYRQAGDTVIHVPEAWQILLV